MISGALGVFLECLLQIAPFFLLGDFLNLSCRYCVDAHMKESGEFVLVGERAKSHLKLVGAFRVLLAWPIYIHFSSQNCIFPWDKRSTMKARSPIIEVSRRGLCNAVKWWHQCWVQVRADDHKYVVGWTFPHAPVQYVWPMRRPQNSWSSPNGMPMLGAVSLYPRLGARSVPPGVRVAGKAPRRGLDSDERLVLWLVYYVYSDVPNSDHDSTISCCLYY